MNAYPVNPDEPQSLSVLEEIDEACDEFEIAWRADLNPRIEKYVEIASERARAGLLPALLRVEIACRLERNETILPRDYTPRFPKQAALIDTLLGGHQYVEESRELTHAGRYLLEDPIGSGGMGDVYRAHDPGFDRPLAVKVMRKEFKDRPDMVKRFPGEAKITGQLQHPGVPPVHEIGTLSDGRPFMAMKLIRGRTLEELLPKRKNPADRLQTYMAVFKQICQTLAFAHSQGVIHRDLKPANIMVGSHGEVQVMDWGLAKFRRSGDRVGAPKAETRAPDQVYLDTVDGQTRPGAVMGSFAYMPPEQARGEVDRLDERSDVFSLGAILCVILTGQPPYREGSKDTLLQQAISANLAEALRRLQACGADEELVKLARACLSQEMADRPRDAGAVAKAVAAYQAGQQERLHRFELEREAIRVRAREVKKRSRVTLVMALAISVIVVVIPLGAVVGALWSKGVRDNADAEKVELEDSIAKLQKINQDLKRSMPRRQDPIVVSVTSPTLVQSEVKSPAAPDQIAGEKPTPNPFQKEYDALQGTWVLVWEEVISGLGSLKGLRLIIKDEHITVDLTASNVGIEPVKVSYKVHPDQHPKAIDLSSNGSDSCLCIYELEGQVLRVCGVWQSSQQRPAAFKAEAGGQAFLMVFRRVNDKELRVLKKAEELQDLREQLSRIETELDGEKAFLVFGIEQLPAWNYTQPQVRLNRMECGNRIALLEKAEAQIKQLLRELSAPGPEAPKPTPPPPPQSPEDRASTRLGLAKSLMDAGKTNKAKERLKEILKEFRTTKAAVEAQKLLKELDK
jgi:uncharacterized protein (TIGR03067 family)